MSPSAAFESLCNHHATFCFPAPPPFAPLAIPPLLPHPPIRNVPCISGGSCLSGGRGRRRAEERERESDSVRFAFPPWMLQHLLPLHLRSLSLFLTNNHALFFKHIWAGFGVLLEVSGLLKIIFDFAAFLHYWIERLYCHFVFYVMKF